MTKSSAFDPKFPKELDYDGKRYLFDGSRLYGKTTFLTPPLGIVRRLEGMIRRQPWYEDWATWNSAARLTHCFSCKCDLDSRVDPKCKKCGWLRCDCKACGCIFNWALR